MQEHISKTDAKNHELTQKFEAIKTQENEIRNKLEQMSTENNNITMVLTQQIQQLEKENGTLMHDISTIPSGEVRKTRHDEISELNEYDNISQKSVSTHIKRVDKHITANTEAVNDEFFRMKERLLEHFKIFERNVRQKFNEEVVEIGIDQEFYKLSPIKQQYAMDDDRDETVEDSILSGIESSDEYPTDNQCLSPGLKDKKTFLLKAYGNPLQGYKIDDDFRRQTRIKNDVKHMDVDNRHLKNQRTVSVEQVKRREQMKKRFKSNKLTQKNQTMRPDASKQMLKSGRFLNAFDSHDQYPEDKFTDTIMTPAAMANQSLTPRPSTSPFKLNRTKSVAAYGKKKASKDGLSKQASAIFHENSVKRKKDELVKTLLQSNRNR